MIAPRTVPMIRRQLRLRVLQTLERAARGFRTREDLWPLRIPREPLPLDEVIVRALDEDARRFDAQWLRSRTLLSLDWEDGSQWELWLVVLPSHLKLFCDTGEEESRVLASGGRHAGDDTVRRFLERLAESGGQDFGIEMAGGAPSRVRTSLTDRAFLVETFVTLFEVIGAEDSVRRQLHAAGPRPTDTASSDFRHDVEIWLARALKA